MQFYTTPPGGSGMKFKMGGMDPTEIKRFGSSLYLCVVFVFVWVNCEFGIGNCEVMADRQYSDL